MNEGLLLSYTLKDIETIGKVVKRKSEEMNMTYQECLKYILDIQIPEGPDVVPTEIEEIYDIVYHNLYVFNEELNDVIEEETSFLRYKLEDSVRFTALVTTINILLRMSVVEEDLEQCVSSLAEINETIEIKAKEPKWLLIIKKTLFGEKAKARFRWTLKDDSPLFKTFIYFVFETDMKSIVENSLLIDDNRILDLVI